MARSSGAVLLVYRGSAEKRNEILMKNAIESASI
jgi:hypothetical protein